MFGVGSSDAKNEFANDQYREHMMETVKGLGDVILASPAYTTTDYSKKMKFADVTITCADNVVLYYCKFIFDMRQVDYFVSMLNNTWSESNGNIKLNYSSQIVNLLLNDIYHGVTSYIKKVGKFYEYIRLIDEIQYNIDALKKLIVSKINSLRYCTFDNDEKNTIYDLLITRSHLISDNAYYILTRGLLIVEPQYTRPEYDDDILIGLTCKGIPYKSYCACVGVDIAGKYIRNRHYIGTMSIDSFNIFLDYMRMVLNTYITCRKNGKDWRCQHESSLVSLFTVIDLIKIIPDDNDKKLNLLGEFNSILTDIRAMYRE